MGVAGAGRGDAGRGGSTGSAGHGRVPPPADDESSPRALGAAARETRTFVHESAKPPRAVAKWLLASDRSIRRVEIDRGALSRSRKHAITFLLGHWSGSALARRLVAARSFSQRAGRSSNRLQRRRRSTSACTTARSSEPLVPRVDLTGMSASTVGGQDVAYTSDLFGTFLLVLRRVSRRRRAGKSAHRQERRRIRCGLRRELAGRRSCKTVRSTNTDAASRQAVEPAQAGRSGLRLRDARAAWLSAGKPKGVYAVDNGVGWRVDDREGELHVHVRRRRGDDQPRQLRPDVGRCSRRARRR